MTTSPAGAARARSRRATRADPLPSGHGRPLFFPPGRRKAPTTSPNLYVGEWYCDLTSQTLASTLGKGITTYESLPGKVPRPHFRLLTLYAIPGAKGTTAPNAHPLQPHKLAQHQILNLSSTRRKGRLQTDDENFATGKKPVNALPRERYHDLRIPNPRCQVQSTLDTSIPLGDGHLWLYPIYAHIKRRIIDTKAGREGQPKQSKGAKAHIHR